MSDPQQPQAVPDPITQESANFRRRLPIWVRELPQFRFPPLDENFQLIKQQTLRDVLKKKGTADSVIDAIIVQMNDVDHDVMRLFRQRDFEASEQQNWYRLYQLGYMFLATAATFFGSAQALSFGSNPRYVALFALIQTIIAGFTTFLSFISTREPPLPRWMENRRKAEFLRREYFRYVIGLPPYDNPNATDYQRKQMLATRAAKANAGEYASED